MSISNFQTRFAFTNADGTLTSEASRMLREWFVRIGGPNSTDLSAIESLLAALTVTVGGGLIDLAFTDQAAEIAELRKDVEDLKRQLAVSL
jgi:ABC-type cobalt transport system substrate-binding protein